LLCTDGLSSYPKQALKVLREPLRTGKRGRPQWNYPEVANSFLLRDRNPLHCSFFIIRGAQVA
jgi:hypothetical protein